jgi:hypothetical protein
MKQNPQKKIKSAKLKSPKHPTNPNQVKTTHKTTHKIYYKTNTSSLTATPKYLYNQYPIAASSQTYSKRRYGIVISINGIILLKNGYTGLPLILICFFLSNQINRLFRIRLEFC